MIKYLNALEIITVSLGSGVWNSWVSNRYRVLYQAWAFSSSGFLYSPAPLPCPPRNSKWRRNREPKAKTKMVMRRLNRGFIRCINSLRQLEVAKSNANPYNRRSFLLPQVPNTSRYYSTGKSFFFLLVSVSGKKKVFSSDWSNILVMGRAATSAVNWNC